MANPPKLWIDNWCHSRCKHYKPGTIHKSPECAIIDPDIEFNPRGICIPWLYKIIDERDALREFKRRIETWTKNRGLDLEFILSAPDVKRKDDE